VEGFFDLCIFINIIVLSLSGFISMDIVIEINEAITLILFIELQMKLISTKLSKLMTLIELL
jgi:hypothetical protein